MILLEKHKKTKQSAMKNASLRLKIIRARQPRIRSKRWKYLHTRRPGVPKPFYNPSAYADHALSQSPPDFPHPIHTYYSLIGYTTASPGKQSPNRLPRHRPANLTITKPSHTHPYIHTYTMLPRCIAKRCTPGQHLFHHMLKLNTQQHYTQPTSSNIQDNRAAARRPAIPRPHFFPRRPPAPSLPQSPG